MSKALFVVKRNGVDVPYRGWTAKRPAPSESDCFRLAPGEARTGSFQLDDAYEMSPLGTYEVRYETFNPQFPSASLVKVVSETVVLEVE